MEIAEPTIFITLLLGVTFIVTGFLMYKFPPKKINHLIGYRTERSMKSQESWNFAQIYSSKLMIRIGFMLLPFMVLSLVEALSDIQQILILLAGLIFLVIYLFIKTEKAIKNKFP